MLGAKIIIPITHWAYSNGKKQLETEAETLGEAIMDLSDTYPDMAGQILDKSGRLLDGIEIAIGNETVFPWQPDRVLNDDDTIRISSVITGG